MAKKLTRNLIKIKRLQKYDIDIENIDFAVLKNFKEKCKYITDFRMKNKNTYKIWDIVVVAFLATLANCNNWEEIERFANKKYTWLRNFLQLTGGIPCASTYKNVFAIIKSNELEDILISFYTDIISLFSSNVDILNIDGKTDNASGRNKNELRDKIRNLNSLNIYSNNLGICLASEMIDEKTNEITAVPNLLSRVNIKDCVVTCDALNTQKNTVNAVINNKGNYVFALKGNQHNFYDDVTLFFDEEHLNIIRSGHKGVYLTHNEKSHSSIIKYEYFQTEDINWFSDKESWNGLKSFGLVIKTTTKNMEVEKKKKDGSKVKKLEEVTSVEKRYYISSLNHNIVLFSNSIRKHWSVENKLHWHLDFTFDCDNNTTIDKYALLNLQIVKKFSLALLNKSKDVYDDSLKGIRQTISLDFENEIIRFFNIVGRKKKTVF